MVMASNYTEIETWGISIGKSITGSYISIQRIMGSVEHC